ncbi:DUF885 domain-containing protein [Aliidiomarina minuta]|uniref:DUF885 domain-containing protein n=1 Tax=Aliidiomarina minuta TaxID=880057 RepID=A0A432W1N4_9GAMM|nr:DUF885 domain-containing protein [Aliidiomarina minuta]RUO23026.1 DUF885 domain-containing protein [Aliidiomarina minuta]
MGCRPAGVILTLTVLLAACQEPAQPSAQEAAEHNSELSAWLDARYAEEITFSPSQLTRQGSRLRYDEIDSVSNESAQQRLQWKASSVQALTEQFDYAKLSAEEQLSYDLWVLQYQQQQEAAEFRQMHYVFEQMIGPQSRLPQLLIGSHEVQNHRDMGAYNKRIRAIASTIEELIGQAKEQAGSGIRPPAFAYREVRRQALAVISGAPFGSGEDSPLWADAQHKIAQLEADELITSTAAVLLRQDTEAALQEALLPAYQALIDWLDEDIENTEENPVGISRHAGGEDFYKHLLAFYTTTDMTAAEIHQLGLDEVDRLTDKMLEIKSRVDFDGDLQDFFSYIRNDERFFYPNTNEGREAYLQQARDYLGTMQERLPDYFKNLPDIPLEVRRVEAYREQDGAPQHYMSGAADGSRPGVFYAHLSDMQSMPKNELEAIAYHEGVPGHHLQISIAQQLQNTPDFRTQARFTVYSEGWALYAEWLAREMGAYEDPYSEFGQVVTELWRAVRLVVDTGLHAKEWTKEDAIDYFMQKTPIAEGAVRTEVHRYMTIPGQATSFKIGMQRIQDLRNEAEQALGDRFDIREFHDAVLGGGALPLPLLERRVSDWIEAH